MKVLLVCAAGMSTSMLTANMRKHGEEEDVVEAFPMNELADQIGKYDVILLAPQVRFREKEVRAMAEPLGKKVGVIDMRAYGMMDGKNAMDQARELLA